MSEPRPSSGLRWRRSAVLLLSTGLAAGCFDDIDDSVAPGSEAKPERTEPRVLGFVEVSFDGIGTPNLSSSVLSAPSLAQLEALRAQRESGEDIALDPSQISEGDGTIQFGSRTSSRDTIHNGYRYVHGTYQVRNADRYGTQYTSPRNNLTLYGIWTDSTVAETAIRYLRLSNGEPADSLLARQVLPAGRVELEGDTLISIHPDVLQVMADGQVNGLCPTGIGCQAVFPYGFVVRNDNDLSRVLPPSPGSGQHDGEIDFAFRIPKQADDNDDPTSLAFTFVATDDPTTYLTQSLEEQTPAGREEVFGRDLELSPDTVTVLPGGGIGGGVTGGLRTICSVRTAGSAPPTAFLVNADWTSWSFDPDPYATDGSSSSISRTTQFEATLGRAVTGIGPNSFTVRGLQSGPAFKGAPYSGNGTTVIRTPQANFLPGEEVEIALTGPCPQPRVARYHVRSGPASGTFAPDTTYGTGNGPISVAIGDLDLGGTEILDLAVANLGSASVSVLLGQLSAP